MFDRPCICRHWRGSFEEKSVRPSPFEKLGINGAPVVLAPLAGVSDQPFRRVCMAGGADLTYVEMLSAVALLHNSRRTFDMLDRHESEPRVGVQITGRSADETARAIEILDQQPYDTIDINMGCPVQKVVKQGCGSAILKDPQRVYETVKLSRQATDKPLSVKIRIGWDRESLNALEVADAAQAGGAEWLTVHGRTRSDDYSVPVSLDHIHLVKSKITIPVLGNGNVFGAASAEMMRGQTGVDGVMVSRGALGNPWIFARIKGEKLAVTVDEWEATVIHHLEMQAQTYGLEGGAAVRMRKHLLWYCRGWPGARYARDRMNQISCLRESQALVREFAQYLRDQGVKQKEIEDQSTAEELFNWDPKYQMDRQLDRGVGDDGLETTASN
jgi:nifR3 family TIM-barrel protein